MDRVAINFFDGKTVRAGGDGGKTQMLHFPPSDCITKASVWASEGTINSLQFHTKNGLDSCVFGGKDRSSNELTVLTAPPGKELVGMHGSESNSLIKTIEFKWGSSKKVAAESEKVAAEREVKRQTELRERLKSILAAMMEEGLTLDDVAFEWGNCEKAAAEQKLKRQSQLKDSLKNLLTKMKEEDVTLDDEELGSMTDLCNTDEMRGS